MFAGLHVNFYRRYSVLQKNTDFKVLEYLLNIPVVMEMSANFQVFSGH